MGHIDDMIQGDTPVIGVFQPLEYYNAEEKKWVRRYLGKFFKYGEGFTEVKNVVVGVKLDSIVEARAASKDMKAAINKLIWHSYGKPFITAFTEEDEIDFQLVLAEPAGPEVEAKEL